VIYLKLLIKKWWGLMSCAIYTGLAFYVAVANKPNDWLVKAMFVSAAFCLIWASYSVWADEHEKAKGLLREKEGLERERDDRTPQLTVVVHEALLTTVFGPNDFFIDAQIANERFMAPSLVLYYELRVRREGKDYVTRTALRDVNEYQVYCVGQARTMTTPQGSRSLIIKCSKTWPPG